MSVFTLRASLVGTLERDARLLQLRRPGRPRDAGPDADPRADGGAGAGRRGRRAVDVRERPARPRRTTRPAATLIVFGLPDGAQTVRPVARGGPVPRPGRRQRARRDPQLPRRRAGRAARRPGSRCASEGREAPIHARRDRPVAHPAAVPLRAVLGARHADPRRRQGRDPDAASPRPADAGLRARHRQRRARHARPGAGSRSRPPRPGARSRRRSTPCSTRCCCSCR